MRIFFNTITSLAFSISIIKFSLDGKLSYFVNPVYNKMILVSAVVLSIAVLVFIVIFFKSKDRHFHYHYGSKENILLVIFLIGITGIVNFVDIRPLSASTAKLRGLSQDIQGDFSSSFFGKAPEQRTLLEWITSFNYNPDTRSYVGQKVNVEGFVILDDSLPEKYFYIGKSLIRCCLADAITGVLPVKYDKNKFTPIEDEWISISGEMMEAEIDNKIQSVIDALEINKINTPNNPYES